MRVRLVEIFEDRQRLEQCRLAIDEGGHDHLRVDRTVAVGELVALFEMQVHVLAREAFQTECDAPAERSLRAVIGVELHPGSPSAAGVSVARGCADGYGAAGLAPLAAGA